MKFTDTDHGNPVAVIEFSSKIDDLLVDCHMRVKHPLDWTGAGGACQDHGMVSRVARDNQSTFVPPPPPPHHIGIPCTQLLCAFKTPCSIFFTSLRSVTILSSNAVSNTAKKTPHAQPAVLVRYVKFTRVCLSAGSSSTFSFQFKYFGPVGLFVFEKPLLCFGR